MKGINERIRDFRTNRRKKAIVDGLYHRYCVAFSRDFISEVVDMARRCLIVDTSCVTGWYGIPPEYKKGLAASIYMQAYASWVKFYKIKVIKA